MGIAEMKPFDLEAAKRGEPICLTADGKPYPVYFIGTMSNGEIVIECDAKPMTCLALLLFMAPKKRTVFVNLYPHEHLFRVGSYTTWDTAEQAAEAAKNERSLATVIPIEIEV